MSMSGDIDEAFSKLSHIKELLDQIESGIGKVSADTPQVEHASLTLAQATRMAFRFNHLLAHMGLPGEIGAALVKLQKVVFMLRMLVMSMTFLSMGTPYGMIMGALGIFSIAADAGSGSLLEGY